MVARKGEYDDRVLDAMSPTKDLGLGSSAFPASESDGERECTESPKGDYWRQSLVLSEADMRPVAGLDLTLMFLRRS